MHIAIIGCGQLARMMALAGIPYGFTFCFFADSNEDDRSVEGLGKVVRMQNNEPAAQLYELLGSPAAITVEKEQVDVALLEGLEKYCPVRPTPQAFALCQHRFYEKQLLDRLAIPCSTYTHGLPLNDSVAELGLPVVVKSCRGGYDGKNQWVIRDDAGAQSFERQRSEMAAGMDDFIVERLVPFDQEVSQVSVRDANGEVRHYPLTENVHTSGILSRSIAPASNVSEDIALQAQNYVQRIMEDLDYVGVMAAEFFLEGQALMVNELAPRVHNSGHWTQSGSKTSQFENHIRAIAGLPLGSTDAYETAGMLNLIGRDKPSLERLADHAKLHWYNKAVRPGRKLGHINFTGTSIEEVLDRMKAFE